MSAATVTHDDELLDAHAQACALLNLRDTTIRQRRYAVNRFRRYLGGRPLLGALPEDLTTFLSRPLSPEGRAAEISHMKGFYRWAVELELLDADPTRHLRRPKIGRKLPRPLETDDVNLALRDAPERIRPWLYLMVYAGLRCMEVSQLRREEVLVHNDPPLLLVVDGKGGKQRIVPIAPPLLAEIRRWQMPASGWLFLRRDGNPGPVPPHLVSHLVCQYLKSLGLEAVAHQGRHTFGTAVYRQTSDLRVTQELLGHSSPATTAGYAAWSPHKAVSAMQALDYAATAAAPEVGA